MTQPTEYQRRSTQIAWARGRLEDRLADLAATTDPTKRELLTDAVARAKTEVARLERLQNMEGQMAGNINYTNAKTKILDAHSALSEMAELDADRERYPAKYYDQKRVAIIERARIADTLALQALAEYQRDAMTEARKLRIAADAERDPMVRMADELERSRLISSPTPAARFAERAAELLAAGQPRRAALLLSVAQDKGANGTGTLQHDIDEALDLTDETRAKARQLEDVVVKNSTDFNTARLGTLAKYGIGVNPDGSFGSGAPGQTAAASVGAKLTAWAESITSGNPYTEPEGVLSGVPLTPQRSS